MICNIVVMTGNSIDASEETDRMDNSPSPARFTNSDSAIVDYGGWGRR